MWTLPWFLMSKFCLVGLVQLWFPAQNRKSPKSSPALQLSGSFLLQRSPPSHVLMYLQQPAPAPAVGPCGVCRPGHSLCEVPSGLITNVLCTLFVSMTAGCLLCVCVLEWLGQPVAWALSDPLAAQHIHHLISLGCFPERSRE